MDDTKDDLTTPETGLKFAAVITKALVALQAEVKSIGKTAENSHFKNTYAPLDAVMDYALPLLAKHKLSLSQWPVTIGGKPYLHTVLMHEAGETVQSDLELLLTRNDPQSLGSALTYQRRQSVMAILGISAKDEDDDGNKASGNQEPATQEQLEEIASLCRMLKFPPEDVEKKLRTITTSNRAVLALADLEKIIAGRASAVKAAKAVDEAAKVEVIADDEMTPHANIARRLKGIGLKDDAAIRELVRTVTGKPFLKNCKDADLEKLASTIDDIESGEMKLPAKFYGPTKEATVVEEPIA